MELRWRFDTTLPASASCPTTWPGAPIARRHRGSRQHYHRLPSRRARNRVKLAEARQALKDGGQELDVVINISKARSGDWQYVRDELAQLADCIHAGGARIKVIFENAYLDDAEKIRLCEICAEIGADWVKTSTGFAPSGATLPDLKLMREHSSALCR